MIRAWYARGEGVNELDICGHAEYGPRGQDIVCAGVSALVYALVGALEEIAEDVAEVEGPVFEEGRIYLRCRGGERTETAFRMAVVGLRQMAGAYPRHLVLTERL